MNSNSKGKITIPLKRQILSWAVEGKGKFHFQMAPGKFTVGRLNTNNIVIDDDSVSRRHAQLSLEGQDLYVEDLASTRGTWIGKTRIKPYTRSRVPPGVSLWIGTVEVKYEPVQAKQIPILLLAGVGGALILIATVIVLVTVLSTAAKSVNLTCPSTALLISLPEASSQSPAPLPTDTVAPTSQNPAPTTAAGTVETPTSAPAAVSASQQFLDLPFPYHGPHPTECGPGTDAEFLRASQRSSQAGGRINSFFDHVSPIYIKESPEEKKIMLIFTGQLTQDSYSGHDGIDFEPIDATSNTTRVCAPADGKILTVGVREDIGNYIEIQHDVTVDGQGVIYKTLYGHLFMDDYLMQTKSRIGEMVKRYDILATMDNTGKNTTGSHLHFGTSIWQNSGWRVVDPYGFIPSTNYPADPWSPPSKYLWIHPYPQSTVTFPTTTGAKLDPSKGVGGESMALPQLCSPAKAMPSGGMLSFSLAISPSPLKELISIANGITFFVQDAQGNTVTKFEEPIQIMIPYADADLTNIVPGSLQIWFLNEEKNEWDFKTTLLDTKHHLAGAQVEQPGEYVLFGKPKADVIPPKTTITAHGLQAPNGYWCGPVSVNISGQDDRGSIAQIKYRYRDEEDWQYQKNVGSLTHTLNPEGKPADIPTPANPSENQVEYSPGTGRFLVQAWSTDNSGNTAILPTTLYIVIDPTIDPSQCVDTTQTKADSK